MHEIFKEQNTEAALLIDATNAFNTVNRKVLQHNVKMICPAISTYVNSCYSLPSRLFVIVGAEITEEGTTQGDPTAMAIYAIAIIPLIMMLLELTEKFPSKQTKMVVFADDLSAGRSLSNIKKWWKVLCNLGPKFGYNPEASKCWLIIKLQLVKEAEKLFENSKINVTVNCKRHLGAVIGSQEYRDEYVINKTDQIANELNNLCEIAKLKPQTAYSCFVSGFKDKQNYTVRTIPDISHLLKPIDHIILTKFMAAITDGVKTNQIERKLLSLRAKYGLSIPIFAEISDDEYKNSLNVTKHLRNNILQQQHEYTTDHDTKTAKNMIKQQRESKTKTIIEELKNELNANRLHLMKLNQEQNASSWLTSLPLKEGYIVNKQCFFDLIRICYGGQLDRLPSKCECGSTVSIDHALSCKKGGFVSLRHNQVRKLKASLLDEVCHDVCVGPQLLQLTGENLNEKMVARRFWVTGQMAFFDVRVFNRIAKRYVHRGTSKAYQLNKKEKNRNYNERILEVEHGSFTPIVMSAYGGIGKEGNKFFQHDGLEEN